jgi:hypothetical protein
VTARRRRRRKRKRRGGGHSEGKARLGREVWGVGVGGMGTKF